MKRFLSMLATLVLVGQSVVTPAVYAMQGASENEESVSETVVEATIDESDADDGSSDDEVVADVDDSTNDAEESAELEETADAEEAIEADNSEISEEPENAEEDETLEVVETEKVEETADVEEISTEDEESSIEEPVFYGKSFFSEQQEKSWTEISENRLVVTVVDSLGAFKDGTEMVVTAVEEDDIFDLVNDAIEANVTKVKAVDITFWYDGQEVEPALPINVTIRALNMSEPQTVVHIDTGYNEEKINIGEVDVEEIDANIKGKTAEFETKAFSIYAIVETDDDRLLVNFKNGDTVIASGYLKDASEVESLIFDPGVGDLENGKVFRGWTTEKDYTTDTTGMTIEEVRGYITDNFSAGTRNFYAMIFNNYAVTYLDDLGVVIGVDEVITSEDSYLYEISRDFSPRNSDEKFEGWKNITDEDDTDLYNIGDTKSITKDTTFKAYVPAGYWLVFKENGKGVTYTPPQFIQPGEKPVKPSNPSRVGYEFGGWYTNPSCEGEQFDFDSELSERTILYADWSENKTAKYTVILWKQNVAGDGYDFVKSILGEGGVHSPLNSVVSPNGDGAKIGGTNYSYGGFHYDSFTGDEEIKAEGNSVVNVYFNRNDITFNFYVYDYTYTVSNGDNDNTPEKYGDVDGKKARVYRKNNAFRTSDKNNGTVYNGTVYTRSNSQSWNLHKTMSGLYGSTLSGNNYTWPEEYDWRENQGTNGNPSGTRTTFLDAFLPTSNNTTVNFYGETPSGNNHIYFLQQNANGNGYTIVNTVKTSGINFNLSDKYNGFKCVAWNTSNNTGTWNKVGTLMNHEGDNYYDAYPSRDGYQYVTFRSNLYVYFDRLTYDINYMDGVYVDGDGNQLNKNSQAPFDVVENITYGADISSYSGHKIEKEGYVLEGWYADEDCTEPYKFNTMPEGGVTVHAKWRQVEYRVFLHPLDEDEEDTSLDLGGQATSFRVEYGGQIAEGNNVYGTRDEYELVGWYMDKDADGNYTNPFNFGAYTLNDGITTNYDKTQSTELDEYGKPIENTNKDKNRFWINKKLDLYAKWRSKLEGAEGINVVYDAGDGSISYEDNKSYVDKASAVALPAATAPDDQQFKYWRVQKWNGSAYEDTDTIVYPGQEFSVLKKDSKILVTKWANNKNESASGYDVITVENPTPGTTAPDATHTVIKEATYTIQVRAEYGNIEVVEPTEIEYCANYDGGTCEKIGNITPNEKYEIEDNRFGFDKGTGYVFSGWNTKSDRSGDGYKSGDIVGVNDVDPTPNKLYAQWDCAEGYKEVEVNVCEIKKYLITFVNEDGTVLQSEDVAYGEMPSYAGSTPTKKSDGTYTYEFSGWTPEIEVVTTGATYTATYTSVCAEGYTGEANGECTKKVYTITWNNDDNTLIDTTTVEHGDMPTHADAVKEATGYVYTFAGWTPTIVAATGDATYTATYTGDCDQGYHDQSLEPSTNNNEAIVGADAGRIINPTVTSEDTNNEAVNEGGNTATAGLVCVPNTKTVDCTEGKDAHGTYTVTGVEITWTDNGWSEPAMCKLSCERGYHLNANGACEKDSNGGGGGGSSGGGGSCRNLPSNAVANNDLIPNSSTSYSYSTNVSEVCTFQCKSGYTRNEEKGTCDVTKEPGGNSGGDDEEEIELGGQVSDKCSVEGSNRSEEEIAAYLYACENDITTIRDINKARLGDFLTRAEMAKMVSVFATKELGMKPNTSKDCSNFANSIASYNQEMKDYMVMSCQLELMGIHTVNYEPIPDFMPSKRVSRAEFGTVLSRVLWGNKYEGTNSNYYINHLNALKENKIITNINPNITEYRAWVFLMLYRSVEAIKVLKATSNETVEQQVNEELQEERKAETGLVIEYDSGSVVPDMATVTESGTLSTGTVAEIITGSVVETETGATTTLTGDDISKEVSDEAGTVVETGSTSD